MNTSRNIDLNKDTTHTKGKIKVKISADGVYKTVKLYNTVIAEIDTEIRDARFYFGGHYTKTTMTAINTVLREFSSGLFQLKSVNGEIVVLRDVGGYLNYMETGKGIYKKLGIFHEGITYGTLMAWHINASKGV